MLHRPFPILIHSPTVPYNLAHPSTEFTISDTQSDIPDPTVSAEKLICALEGMEIRGPTSQLRSS